MLSPQGRQADVVVLLLRGHVAPQRVRVGGTEPQVGPAVVNDPDGRARHEIDVLALERGRRIHDDKARVLVLGEAKSTNKARTVADLVRLDRIRDTLVTRKLDAADARLVLFARNGFDERLHDAAATRPDVHLVALDDLYT